MNDSKLINFLTALAITGNALFAFWIAFNAMDEGLSAKPFEVASLGSLLILLSLNIFLLS